jgi:hypothetical protein
LSVDLTSLFDNWNGNNFNQGANPVTGTASGGSTGTFTASWTSLINGGPFNGQTGTYNVTGTYSVVPIPAAAWLMGSGLVGLATVARRRKRKDA